MTAPQVITLSLNVGHGDSTTPSPPVTPSSGNGVAGQDSDLDKVPTDTGATRSRSASVATAALQTVSMAPGSVVFFPLGSSAAMSSATSTTLTVQTATGPDLSGARDASTVSGCGSSLGAPLLQATDARYSVAGTRSAPADMPLTGLRGRPPSAVWSYRPPAPSRRICGLSRTPCLIVSTIAAIVTAVVIAVLVIQLKK